MTYQNDILLVDDEPVFNKRLAKAFVKRGFTVFQAENYDDALAIVERHRPALAVVDLKMPGKSGLEVVQDALGINKEMKIVILTGYGSIATATDAVRLGAFSYIAKPADIGDILNAFSREPELDIKVEEEDLIPPSLARTEWEHINRVLSDCDGNISQTAKRLGIHRRTLQRKLYKYPPKR